MPKDAAPSIDLNMEKLKAMCKLEESGIIDTKDLQLEISKVKSQLQAEIMYYRQEKGMNTLFTNQSQ